MKKITFVLLTCFCTSAFGQELTFTELKNGFSDFETFIVELTQKGFYIDRHEVDENIISVKLLHEDENEWSSFRVGITHASDTKIGYISLLFYAFINESKADRYKNLYKSIEEIKLNCEKSDIWFRENDQTYVSCYRSGNIIFEFYIKCKSTSSQKTNATVFRINSYTDPEKSLNIKNNSK